MQTLSHDVVAVAKTVWSTILGVELSDAPPRPAAGAPAIGPAFECRVRICGAWNGAVVLLCGRATAARAAATLFGVEPDATTAEQMRDVVGELTNVLGGNIKALLPQPSRLSLPDFVELGEAGEEHATEVVADVLLSCDGEPLRVVLVRRA